MTFKSFQKRKKRKEKKWYFLSSHQLIVVSWKCKNVENVLVPMILDSKHEWGAELISCPVRQHYWIFPWRDDLTLLQAYLLFTHHWSPTQNHLTCSYCQHPWPELDKRLRPWLYSPTHTGQWRASAVVIKHLLKVCVPQSHHLQNAWLLC